MKYIILILLLSSPAYARSHISMKEHNLKLEEKYDPTKLKPMKESSVYDFFDKKADNLTKKRELIRNYNYTIHNPEECDPKKEKCN